MKSWHWLKLVAEVLSSTQSWLPHLNALTLYSLTILKPIMISYVSKVWWLNLSSLNIWTASDEVDMSIILSTEVHILKIHLNSFCIYLRECDNKVLQPWWAFTYPIFPQHLPGESGCSCLLTGWHTGCMACSVLFSFLSVSTGFHVFYELILCKKAVFCGVSWGAWTPESESRWQLTVLFIWLAIPHFTKCFFSSVPTFNT